MEQDRLDRANAYRENREREQGWRDDTARMRQAFEAKRLAKNARAKADRNNPALVAEKRARRDADLRVRLEAAEAVVTRLKADLARSAELALEEQARFAK